MKNVNNQPDDNLKKTQNIEKILNLAKTGHGLDLFTDEEIKSLQQEIFYKRGRPYVKCFVSEIGRAHV